MCTVFVYKKNILVKVLLCQVLVSITTNSKEGMEDYNVSCQQQQQVHHGMFEVYLFETQTTKIVSDGARPVVENQ